MSDTVTYRFILQQEFEARKKRDRDHFSLRAFARLLQLDPSDLSRILAGKVRVSPKMARRITERLELEPQILQSFIESVLEEQVNHIKKVLEGKPDEADRNIPLSSGE